MNGFLVGLVKNYSKGLPIQKNEDIENNLNIKIVFI